jgi:tripeptide aminopeptidase
MINDTTWFEAQALERFIRYVKVYTTSDSQSSEVPTTRRQLDLANMLVKELGSIGIPEASLDEFGFVVARIPSNIGKPGEPKPVIGYIAHLDTSEDAPGVGVNPIVRENYDGKKIPLKEGVVIDPSEFPDLLTYKGETIVTADGTTLLGADDKAGIAEVMTAAEYLILHPEIPRPEMEIIFTPDEETGTGKNSFPFSRVASTVCYTFDGGREGTLEDECFEAYKVSVELFGKAIHLGTARGKLVNAVQMCKSFLSMLPASETPETTDGRFGYYCPLKVTGEIEKASIAIYIRDFAEDECRRRIETLEQIGRTVEMEYPGSRVSVNAQKQYHNMKKFLDPHPDVVRLLEDAIGSTGIGPERESIRGGTDGSFLSEKGIPTPNVFTGGFNFHSRMEWIPLRAMGRAAQVGVHLARLWAEKISARA